MAAQAMQVDWGECPRRLRRQSLFDAAAVRPQSANLVFAARKRRIQSATKCSLDYPHAQYSLMALQSQLFRGDRQLEAAAVSDSAHIVPGARGDHVRKIQLALIQLDGAAIATDGIYGQATAAAVLAFKQERNIINRAIQTTADNIVGKMTIAALDKELENPVANARTCILLPATPLDVGNSGRVSLGIASDSESEFGVTGRGKRATDAEIMAAAFKRSRTTLRSARDKMFDLANALRTTQPLSPRLTQFFKIAAKWLLLNTADRPTAVTALDTVTLLMARHLALKTSTGADPPMKRVAATFFAATFGSVDVGLHVGTPFFTQTGKNCRRDVVTHEFFHLVGVLHGGQALNVGTVRSLIKTTAQALNSADNLSQLVAELETPGGRTDACLRQNE